MIHLLGKISAHVGERGGGMGVLSATVPFITFRASFSLCLRVSCYYLQFTIWKTKSQSSGVMRGRPRITWMYHISSPPILRPIFYHPYLACVARTRPWKPEKAILTLEVELQATVSCHVSVKYREPLSFARPASAFAKLSPQLPHKAF